MTKSHIICDDFTCSAGHGGVQRRIRYFCVMKRKEIRFRCWVDVDGERFFGPGPAQLLRLIEETGSISRAAQAMGMSYRKAWDIVDNVNTRGSKPFVIAQKGGQRGGGAQLTETGKKALVAYEKLAGKIEKIVRVEKALLKLI